MPEPSNYHDTNLDFPVVVRTFPGVAFLSITQSGHAKRIMTTRKGLRIIRDAIDETLDNPRSNENGVTKNVIRD